MKHTFLLAAALCALAPAIAAQDARPSQLKIQKIVLYKHGVGYFEREGKVSGNVTVPLSFKTGQMKDVLKSLFVLDLSGGRIATVLYDSKDPIQKQLEEILFRVPENNALTQFLTQLKGARVRVTVGSAKVEGHVLGIEPVQKKVNDGVITTHKLVLLRDDGVMEPTELQDASSIEILDETVKKDLARMMEIYAKARYADRKTVNLQAEGQGERTVRAGYIIETPIWKTSYRLILDEGQPARLQGWAIVENRTDEDWVDVNLSFVAGSPTSFVIDLYTSYYPQRPVVAVGLATAAEPMTDAGAGLLAGARKDAPAARRARPEAKVAEDSAEKAIAAPGAPAPSLGELLDQQQLPVAQGQALGELFKYEAHGPVTIKQGQAALVPILIEKLEQSERVLYYRADVSRVPSHAMRIVNSTQLTLEKGPVTVFATGACLGEGMLSKTLKTGMTEMLTYAFEPGVEVEQRGDSANRPVSKAVLASGVLTLTFTQAHETRWKLRNKTGKAYPLYLDHPKAGGDFRLVEPKAPSEELPGHYRFKVDLAATGEAELVVREEQPVSTSIAVVNEPTDQIRFHLQQKYLSPGARELLTKVVELMDKRAQLDRETAAATEERTRKNNDMEMARRNLGSLPDTAEGRKLRDQLVQRIDGALRRIDEVDTANAERQRQRADLDRQLATMLQAFRE